MGLKKIKDDSGFSNAVEKVEAENETPVYDSEIPMPSEDGYVHDEPMLHGYYDRETGILHNTFCYREMDGRDEEAINKGDVRNNGSKLANVLVSRCVNQIGDIRKKDVGSSEWEKLIKSLLSGDIDYMMLKIREISKGKTITFTHKCPRCSTKLITEVLTTDFKVIPFQGQEEVPFTLPGRGYRDNHGNYHKEGFIRLINGFDREVITPLMAKNSASANTLLLSRTMNFDDGTPIFQDNVKSMSVKDRSYLEKLHEQHKFGIDTSFEELTCTSCGYDLSDTVGQSDFF